MSDFHREPTTPKARKVHRCVACGARIQIGEKHTQQEGFFDGSAYRNRYHDECWNVMIDDDIGEFVTGVIDPPARLRASKN